MNDLTYRDVTPADLPFIAELGEADTIAAARDPARPGIHEEQQAGLAAIIADPNHRLLLVERDGAPVGSFRLSFIPGVSRQGAWRGQIESVRVAEHMRGQGIGEEMMHWALARCQEKGCGVVQLTSDKQRDAAHRFYKRLGFKPTHTGFKLKLV
jgi:ribosomal protein S18 acetylase RimI-like enzyme